MLLHTIAVRAGPADGMRRCAADGEASPTKSICCLATIAALMLLIFLLQPKGLPPLLKAGPKVALLESARRCRRRGHLFHVDDKRFSAREQRVREQPAERRVREILVVRIPSCERLEDVHLPEAQRLGKVAVRPVDSLPDISHSHRA
eukprot:1578533-Prymnesium_polylepis.1